MLDQQFPNGYRVVYVTNDFHVYRAGRTARLEGLDAQGLGCPSLWYLVPNFYLRESLVILRDWVFGAGAFGGLAQFL